MDKQPYNPQLIRKYLLGVLLEEEEKRLDELSFTDDVFVAALAAAEKDLVDAYVQNELTSEELEKFKSHYLRSHLRRQGAQFAEAFKTVIERESMRSQVIPAQPVVDLPKRQKAFDWSFFLTAFAARSISRWASAAAVVAFLVLGVWFVVQNARLRRQVATTQSQLHELQERERELHKVAQDQRTSNSQDPIQKSEDERRLNETEKQDNEQQRNLRERINPEQRTIASFILTPQLRSASAIPVVSLPPDTLNVRMNLILEPNDYQFYEVALVDPDSNQVLWRSGKLNRQNRGGDTVGVNLGVALLKPKNYLLHLFGIPAGGASEFITQYPFKVVQE